MQESVQIVTIVLIGTLLLLVLAAFVVISLLVYQRSQHRHHKEVTALKNAYERELLTANLETKEETLSTVAQELHDNIGQILSLVKLNLHTMSQHNDGFAGGKLANAKDLLSKAISDLRGLSKTLNTDYLMQQDLPEAIQQSIVQLRKTGMIDATITVSGDEKSLAPQKRLIAYRIYQEAINNVIKHAHASRLDVRLDYDENAVRLSLVDNGNGFDLSNSKSNPAGTGVMNMQHRAKLIGSTFQIESSPNSGTRVALVIPL